MTNQEQNLLKLVNSAGFLFQIRTAHEIAAMSGQHEWDVVAQEHRWINTAGREGFIDIVLQKGGLFVSLECKRVRESGQWVFLLPVEKQMETWNAQLLWSLNRVQDRPISEWDNVPCYPKSLESSFCVIRNQKESNPMLERTAGVLVESVEAFADEIIANTVAKYINKLSIHIPLIVTNASLYACKFATQSIDLNTGELALSDSDFELVPFIRFRKSLTTKYTVNNVQRSIAEISSQNERTVFVVNIEHLNSFLKELRLGKSHAYIPPWEAFMDS